MPGVVDWGTVVIGRLTLRENFAVTANVDASTGFRTITVAGEESMPPLTMAQVQQRQEDFLGLIDRFLPVTFTNKTDHNGWYQITDANTDLTNYTGEVSKFAWSISANRIGAENTAEVESRVTALTRTIALGIPGEIWHAPAASAYAYYTGASAQPSSSVLRAIVDGGSIRVYRGVPASTSPRWSVSLANYQLGRARVLVNAVERVAEDVAIPASASWELNNGILKVTTGAASASSASFRVSSWSGSAWQPIDWNTSITAASANPITSWSQVMIVRNDYELCTVRLIYDKNPGRAQLDLTLRRGSRFVEAVLQQDATAASASVTYSWYLNSAQASTNPAASAMYVAATSNDGNGNQFIVGTSKSGYTALLTQGGMYMTAAASAAPRFDTFIGIIQAGTLAITGDSATNLRDQYFKANSESTRMSRRALMRR